MKIRWRISVAVALALCVASTGWAEHFPEIPTGFVEVQGHGRLFVYHGDLSAMVEYVGRLEEPDLSYRYQSLTAGGYYRAHRNLKVGAFYKLQIGARHDDDWIVAPYPDWVWRDTTGRVEHVAMIDATPRFLLDFLPGRDWVGSVKARYAYNFFNGHQTLLIRPGLTYFWLRDREPFLNVSVQYPGYVALNFGDRLLYNHGPYLKVLYHVSPLLQVDVGVSRQNIYWTESAQFLARHPGQWYPDHVYSPWVVDIGFILTIR